MSVTNVVNCCYIIKIAILSSFILGVGGESFLADTLLPNCAPSKNIVIDIKIHLRIVMQWLVSKNVRKKVVFQKQVSGKH